MTQRERALREQAGLNPADFPAEQETEARCTCRRYGRPEPTCAVHSVPQEAEARRLDEQIEKIHRHVHEEKWITLEEGRTLLAALAKAEQEQQDREIAIRAEYIEELRKAEAQVRDLRGLLAECAPVLRRHDYLALVGKVDRALQATQEDQRTKRRAAEQELERIRHDRNLVSRAHGDALARERELREALEKIATGDVAVGDGRAMARVAQAALQATQEDQ